MPNIYLKVTIEKNVRSRNIYLLRLKNVRPGLSWRAPITQLSLKFKISYCN